MLNYELVRKNEKVVVLGHGLGEDGSICNGQTRYLQGLGFSTLVFELEGHGKSSLNGGMTVEGQAEGLDAILRTEGIEKIYLGGISLGATVALEFSCKYSEKVEKLCLTNPALYGEDFLSWRVKMVRPFLGVLKQLAKLDKKRKGDVDLSKAIFSNAYFSFLNGLRATSMSGLYAGVKALMEYKPKDLDRITAETLIIRSKGDELLTPQIGAKLMREIPQVSLSVERGQHVLLLSNPQRINYLWGKFFSD